MYIYVNTTEPTIRILYIVPFFLQEEAGEALYFSSLHNASRIPSSGIKE